jgi:two-component SAPR family response regulator
MPKTRIFIAEDDDAVTRKIAASLEKLGYVVIGRTDRSEAILPMVQEILPDLVFLEIDIQGEINGVEAAGQIQTDSDIPVIFISAHTDANTRGDAMPAWALVQQVAGKRSSNLYSLRAKSAT